MAAASRFPLPRLIGLTLGLAVLAACGGAPKGFLLPTQTPVSGAQKVDMLVITTRRASPEPGVVFGGERDPSESVSEIVVSVPPGHRVGKVEWPKSNPPDPQREFTTVSLSPADRPAVRAWFQRQGGEHARLLVFVHGFNTRFESSVYRFAQIVADSGADAAPVLFTWPSRGRLFDYEYDRDSAIYSRDALERGLARAADAPEVKEITVLAHSMGTYLTMEALRQLAIRRGRLPAKITAIVLASPDIDPHVFARQYEALGPDAPHVTIFVSRDDRALQISRLLAGNLLRLGSIDPSQEPYRSRLEANGKITIIDLTKLKAGDKLNHGKFAQSPEVVRLLGTQLINGQVLSDGR
ncbi:MAG: alpha/beta hydrolase [Caulobacter sp.]|nr:alpha/beta hydrolase [Caulobacter sp.]